MTVLSARDLTLRRGGRLILDGVSAAFEPGTLTMIIGPNGAGKSTLISVLAGLLRPDGGSVEMDGRPLGAIPQKALAKRRAYLPQNARSEWPISVERVVALGLTPILPAFGDLSADQKVRIAAALEQCDLLHLKDQAATTLSGGELARAMLARALVADPELLLVDEPTAGLDPRHALDAMARLRTLTGKGRTVIAAAHDLALALPFADRVVALREGRVLASGPAETTADNAMLSALYDVGVRIDRAGDSLAVRFQPPVAS